MVSETFLNILDETSLEVYNSNFSALNTNSQNHLKNVINQSYKDICNMHRDWTFMNRVMQISALTPNTDAVHVLTTGTHAPTVKLNLPSILSGNTAYVAQSKVNSNAFPLVVNSVIAYIGFQGINQVQAQGYMLICADLNGSPDLDNIYGTSAAVTLTTTPGATALVSSGINKTFTFTNTGIPKSCTYWIVFKVTCTSGTSTLTISTVTETGTSKTLSPVTSSSWTSNASQIMFTINTYYATYGNVLTVGPGVQEIIGFYDDTERGDRTVALFPEGSRPDAQCVNNDSYEVKRVNSSGIWTVNFKSNLELLSLLMEYKAIATDMSANTDTPLLPSEYRGAIVYKSVMSLRAGARGLNTPDNLKLIAELYAEKIRGLRRDYRPDDLNIQADVDSQGYTPSGLVFPIGFGNKRRGRRYGRTL